jgi:hypothetical protein
VCTGGRVLVHARVFGAEPAAGAGPEREDRPAELSPGAIESWLVALDARNGAVAWQRRLARGASGVAARERPAIGLRVLAPPAAPLGRDRGTVAVSTGLGTLSALAAVDGRLAWSLRATRGPAEARGHVAAPPPSTATLGGSGPGWWLPEDGLALHRLAPNPLGPVAGEPGAGAGLGGLLSATLPAVDRTLLDARGPGLLVRLRAGPAALSEDGGATWSVAFDPGPGERLLCTGRLLGRRALVVGEHALHLLDRTRSLAVLDRVALGPGEAGRLFLDGDRIWVLGPRRVRGFRAP